MSTLRPELREVNDGRLAIPDPTALYMIRDAVQNRKELIHGRLKDNGHACAIGSFFAKNPGILINTCLVDEVAAYNDSMPKVSAETRRNRVLRWLNWRLKVLAGEAKK